MGFFRRKRRDTVGNNPHRPDEPIHQEFSSNTHLSNEAWPIETSESEGFARTEEKLSDRNTRSRPLLRLTATIAVFSFVLIAGWLAAMMFYYTLKFPDPFAVSRDGKAGVIRILASDGSLLAERGTAHPYMPIKMLPKHVIDAIIATEDRRFFNHWGIDPFGMIRAVFANMRAGQFRQGGSTLTQQLAKNLFLSHERTLTRKIDELALAIWLEYRLDKNQILELYLNRVYFGAGAYGVEAAAQRYYGKSARAMNVAEAALIAGLLKAPSHYAPTKNPGAGRARGRSVLHKMFAAGFLSTKQLKNALNQPVRFVKKNNKKSHHSYGNAVDYILARLPRILDTDHSEILVETTIDASLQRTAHTVITDALRKSGKKLNATQAALVILDRSGGVRTLLGGRDYRKSQYNRATKAHRQPGSTFKPFVYLAALEAGYKPETIAYDLPVSIKGWTPKNANGRYTGTISIRDALAKSINTVAVRVALDVGPDKVADISRRMGISSKLRADPSLALGTSEVSLIELVSAYNVLPNGGRKTDLHIIRRIRTSKGRILYARPAASDTQLVSAQNIGAMNSMLQTALQTGTGHRAALDNHPAAGKTGTSQDYRDAWFIGYTAHMTAGIWIGNDDGTSMKSVSGGGLPARIWRTIMTRAHRDKNVLPLPYTTSPGTFLSKRLPAQQKKQVVAKKISAKEFSKRLKLPHSFRERTAARVISEPPLPVRRPMQRFPKTRITQQFFKSLDTQQLGPTRAKKIKLERQQITSKVSSSRNGFDLESIKRKLNRIPSKPVRASSDKTIIPRMVPEGKMALGLGASIPKTPSVTGRVP